MQSKLEYIYIYTLQITTFDIMGVCERKRKKKGNYSDDVDSNSVENVVAMWERRSF